MTKQILIAVVAAALGGLSGCGGGARPAPTHSTAKTTTQMNSNAISVDHAYQGGPLRTILVIGVLNDPELRRRFEDNFVGQLKAKGLGGVTGYSVLPDDEMLTKELIKAQIEETHIDGVLVARVKGVGTVEMETARSNAPETPRALGSKEVSRNDLFGHYAVVLQTAGEPGYSMTGNEVNIELKLFEVSEGTPVWTLSRVTTNPRNASDTIEKLGSIALAEMAKANLIE